MAYRWSDIDTARYPGVRLTDLQPRRKGKVAAPSDRCQFMAGEDRRGMMMSTGSQASRAVGVFLKAHA